MMSCAEFAEKLARAAAKAEFLLAEPTQVVMDEVAKEAKRVIGTYEYGWPELADRTKENRVAAGFPENEPLLRRGSLRADIATKAELTAEGAEGLVYSDQKEALWAELGTNGPGRGQPPRSFLFKSLWLATPVMEKVFGKFAEKLFA
ncbi:MAG TPA: hypothetical protein VEF90_16475 [Xanthobacteraceae bacterium]|nr:hypothetical protein [Xanthobacteraceae bacterium]